MCFQFCLVILNRLIVQFVMLEGRLIVQFVFAFLVQAGFVEVYAGCVYAGFWLYAGLMLSLNEFLGLFGYRQACYAGRLEAGL